MTVTTDKPARRRIIGYDSPELRDGSPGTFRIACLNDKNPCHDSSNTTKPRMAEGRLKERSRRRSDDCPMDGEKRQTEGRRQDAEANTYNVNALFDTSGNVVEHYTYDPYGKVEIFTGKGNDGTWFTSDDDTGATSAVKNPYTFTGRRLDTETGLMYFRNRYYSVDLGRFISRDALEYVDGWNLYRGYFAVNGVDPEGEAIQGLEIGTRPVRNSLGSVLGFNHWYIIVDIGGVQETAGFYDDSIVYSPDKDQGSPSEKGTSGVERLVPYLNDRCKCKAKYPKDKKKYNCCMTSDKSIKICVLKRIMDDKNRPNAFGDYSLLRNNCQDYVKDVLSNCCAKPE